MGKGRSEPAGHRCDLGPGIAIEFHRIHSANRSQLRHPLLYRGAGEVRLHGGGVYVGFHQPEALVVARGKPLVSQRAGLRLADRGHCDRNALERVQLPLVRRQIHRQPNYLLNHADLLFLLHVESYPAPYHLPLRWQN